MERQQGKRVQSPKKAGRRRGRLPLLVVLLAVVILAGGYLGLCAYAMSSETIFPNTSAAGTELGGLTRSEARAQLELALDAYRQSTTSFQCGGQEFTVDGSNLSMDLDQVVEEAYTSSRSGSLLTAGARYLASLVGGTEIQTALVFTATPAAILEAEQYIANPMTETSYTLTEDTLELTKGATGQAIDVEALEAEILARFQAVLTGEDTGSEPLEVPVITEEPPEADLEAIYQAVYSDPADATLNKETGEVVASTDGVSFDVEAARTALDGAAEGETVSVPLTRTEPTVTTADLKANLFRDVLGQSSTRTAGGSSRWHNVDLACQRVNGTILLPGETFSYNDTCGPYSRAGGYQKAGAYVSGTTQDTWAGGVCQLSSTLYYTTLKANLETVERSKHKYDVGYLPSGLDATVYSDSLDFKFKNNTDYPIKIVSSLTNNGGTRYCNVTIYGTNVTGVYGDPYSVTVSVTEAKTVYEPNASVPQGSAPQRDSTRTAYNGKVVEVHQRLRDANGNVISDTVIHTDRFDVRNAVYFYNPADAARLGINTSTGLRTEVPVTPTPTATPAPSATPTPAATPAPTAAPATEPSTAPSASPTPPAESSAPQPTPPAAESAAPTPDSDGVVLPPEAVS